LWFGVCGKSAWRFSKSAIVLQEDTYTLLTLFCSVFTMRMNVTTVDDECVGDEGRSHAIIVVLH
jgi:hypothetical protein